MTVARTDRRREIERVSKRRSRERARGAVEDAPEAAAIVDAEAHRLAASLLAVLPICDGAVRALAAAYARELATATYYDGLASRAGLASDAGGRYAFQATRHRRAAVNAERAAREAARDLAKSDGRAAAGTLSDEWMSVLTPTKVDA